MRKIDFAQLDRLSTRADQELREAEDALIVFMERDRLYLKPDKEPHAEKKWPNKQNADGPENPRPSLREVR